MFNKFAKNILIEVADDCYISSLKANKETKKELENIGDRLSIIANELVEGEVLSINEEH